METRTKLALILLLLLGIGGGAAYVQLTTPPTEPPDDVVEPHMSPLGSSIHGTNGVGYIP